MGKRVRSGRLGVEAPQSAAIGAEDVIGDLVSDASSPWNEIQEEREIGLQAGRGILMWLNKYPIEKYGERVSCDP